MNRHRIPSLFGVAWLASSLLAQASTLPERTDAVVDQVLMPAWVERQGVRQPLSPGLALRNHDRVITGSDAVSYTHLDVYKRQDFFKPGGRTAGHVGARFCQFGCGCSGRR